jgi:hypothetical protein
MHYLEVKLDCTSCCNCSAITQAVLTVEHGPNATVTKTFFVLNDTKAMVTKSSQRTDQSIAAVIM